MKLKKNEEGFTLVEILAVLVIIAVLAAVTVPTMMGFVERAKMDRYIAETKLVCTAVEQYITEESTKPGYEEMRALEDIMFTEIGNKKNPLTDIMEGSHTKGGQISNVMFYYDIFDGIEYDVDGYRVTIQMCISDRASVVKLSDLPHGGR